jgi:XTP/dITP diphosphohydrolase
LKLIFATNNPHKIREYRSLFKAKRLLNFDCYSLAQLPSYAPPCEEGKTFEENAILKAIHAARHFNHWVLADDSGLVVPSLNDAPGIFSARYAGPQASDKENRLKLLKDMDSFIGESRAAFMMCSIALSSPQGLKKCVTGLCEGQILSEERGGNGFGYDSLFRKRDYNLTFAEMDEEIKNQISHRYKAFEKIATYLEFFKETKESPEL